MWILALFFGGGIAGTYFFKNPITGFSLSGALTIIVLILEGIAAIKNIIQ